MSSVDNLVEVVSPTRARFNVRSFDLHTTLSSGQTFRWRLTPSGWTGVAVGRPVILRPVRNGFEAETSVPVADWSWLTRYLRLDDDFEAVVRSFPDDEPMRAALAACTGLRLIRQPAWECLVSFICSSTKQIVQIEQCIELLSLQFGSPLIPFPGNKPVWDFPTPEQLKLAGEANLRACKLGFRAPYVLEAARSVQTGRLNLIELESMTTSEARVALTTLPGVGPKIADCVLLFAYGRQDAFPLDVWMLRGLAALYFPRRRPSPERLRTFADTHFGPWAGYAQQYLFHYARRHRPDLRIRKNQNARAPT